MSMEFSPFGRVDYLVGSAYTWADIEVAALQSPVLRLIVDGVNSGRVTREQALCTAVMYLAHAQIQWLTAEAARRSEGRG